MGYLMNCGMVRNQDLKTYVLLVASATYLLRKNLGINLDPLAKKEYCWVTQMISPLIKFSN